MRLSLRDDLVPISNGTRYLLRHPFQVSGLAVLTVVLAFLGPVLQLQGLLPDEPRISLTLAVVSMIPLELYFLPRFLLALDAEALDLPQNPRATWRATFETRWFAASAAKALLYGAVAASTLATRLPLLGLILLVFFGWTPWRVLLRGEPLGVAARNSARLVRRFWSRALLPLASLLGAYGLVIVGALWFETHFIPEPTTPWVRLSHPAVWALDFAGGLLNLWITLVCLALFHRLEGLSQAATPPD
ncbi:MAG TPA: hypothetical protein VN436_14205 [Holophaga sp.]|nr:hypothetical protein [Holophaga sp.]